MDCPYCEAKNKSRVVDTTRDGKGGIRRRRECTNCGRRFSTYERVLVDMPLLIKSNGERETFDREKLIRGIQIACAKRPIPASGITDLAHRIETHLQQLGKEEVSSRVVGDMVIEGLKALDPIAYIRYAIVYLGLDSLGSVRDMIDSLLAENGGSTPTKAASSPAASGESASVSEANSASA
jgi:transcriptional repressor NrdR